MRLQQQVLQQSLLRFLHKIENFYVALLLTKDYMQGVVTLRCKHNTIHGFIILNQLPSKNSISKIEFEVIAESLKNGYHGIHIHKYGDERKKASSLCDHYNPLGKQHGGRTGKNRHAGDLGNVYFNENEMCHEKFIIEGLNLTDLYGRSIVIHQDEDDLGKGNLPDSKTTGHSGARTLYGIIGRAEETSC